MIDCILHFASLVAALADAQVALNTSLDDQGVQQFLADHVMRIQVWRNSQDTTASVTDGQGNAINVVTHSYLAGLFIEVSLTDSLASKYASLAADGAVVACWDRDKANAGQPSALIVNKVGAVLIQDYRFSPVWAGSSLPFGAWQ